MKNKIQFVRGVAAAAILSLGLQSAQAGVFRYPVPSDDQILTQTGQASLSSAPAKMRILVWNIHKALAGEAWASDFHDLAAGSDMVFVQEGFMNPVYKQAIARNDGYLWVFATSFLYKDMATGVMTGTRWPLTESRWDRSPGFEPLIRTHKMALITYFPLADGRKLMTVNIHGLNFVPNGRFRKQIIPIADALAKHTGPAIFAGDFNTWNPMKMHFLVRVLERAGLHNVPFPDDHRRLSLDHVFVRGLLTSNARILTNVHTSDHAPLIVTIESDPNWLGVTNPPTTGQLLNAGDKALKTEAPPVPVPAPVTP